MAEIVCVGFGSLIWKPSQRPGGPLEAQGVRAGGEREGGSWRADGPRLPVELARWSAETPGEEYVSWVVTPGAAESPCLWAALALPDDVGGDVDRALELARTALAAREGAARSRIGRWPAAGQVDAGGAADGAAGAIAAWARARGEIAGAVWTALPPKWRGDERTPGEAEVLAALRELVARGAHAKAEDYVRRTPAQIDSPIRRAIVRELGWTPFASP